MFFLPLIFLYIISLSKVSFGGSLNETQGEKNISPEYSLNPMTGERQSTIAETHNRRILNVTIVFHSPSVVSDPNAEITITEHPPNTQSRLRATYASRSQSECQEYCKNIISSKLVGTGNKTKQTRQLDNEDSVSLVAGGKRVAYSHKYPHIVALGRTNDDNNFVLFCGGTIISPDWILTAAHCTYGPSGGPTVARLGSDRLSETHVEIVSITRTIRHPLYRPPAMYADIALLRLGRSVTFSKSIKPACLHQQYHNVPNDATICGWGATEFGGGETDFLREARLDFVDNVDCALKHDRSISVPDGVVPSMLCAGAPRNNWQQDTCHGDSGGPLQALPSFQNCFHEIIGITSFGAGCGFTDSPGIYTRVSHYLDWIEDIVWPVNSLRFDEAPKTVY